MLLTVGARGYERTTVREVADRAGIDDRRFRSRFGSKEECFGRAYEGAAQRLCGDLLEVGREGVDWRGGFRAALAELLRFVAEQPLLAKALLVEVRAAHGHAWDVHQRIVERLIAAVDRARDDPGALPSATAITAGFAVGAIERSICLEVGAGRAAEAERLAPDLSHLVMLNYFGADEAWLELCPAGGALQPRPPLRTSPFIQDVLR